MSRFPPLRDPTIPARRAAQRAVVRAGVVWDRFADRFNGLDLDENTILLAFAVAIGVAGALGVVAFSRLIDLAYYLLYLVPALYLTRWGFIAYRPLLTGAGLWIAWLIMRGPGQNYEGANVPDVRRAMARGGGRILAQAALARTAASAVTLGAGGAAAGISAAFNAPLAGAFFALEEILGSLAVGAFPPVVVASVVAAVVSHSFLGNHPAFPIPMEYGFALKREMFLFYPFLGVVTGAVAALFVRVYFGTESMVRRLAIPRSLLPWIGGALVGMLVLLSKGRLVGYGHLAVHVEVFGRMSASSLALLALGSIVATSITLNTGGSGGLFTPSLYVGVATGGAFGVMLTDLFPTLGLRPEAYALVSMGALVAAATSAPITGILLVFEMTKDYAIVLPLMLTTVIANLVARRIEPDSLYSGWLRRRGERVEHGTDRDVLAGLTVSASSETSHRRWWHSTSRPPPRRSRRTTHCSPRSGRWACAVRRRFLSWTLAPAGSWAS